MKIPLTYGFYMALSGAIVTLLMFFTGLHDTADTMPTAQWIQGIGGLAIAVTFFALAMRAKRAATAAEEWGYGSAFGTGALTALYGTLLGATFGYVYFSYINTNMPELMFQMQTAKMEAQGMSADRIAQVEPMMRKWMSPVVLTCFQLIFGFGFSLILSLIVAIFFRGPAKPAAPVEPTLAA